MDENRILRNLRHMAWERAKGELASMGHTFWDRDEMEAYEKFRQAVEKFVEQVEYEGWQD